MPLTNLSDVNPSIRGVLFILDLFSHMILYRLLGQPPYTSYDDISHVDLYQCVNHVFEHILNERDIPYS